MIVLSQTTDKIQAVLGASVATSQAECVASWRDITSTPTYTPGRTLVNTNNTTDVDVVGSPASSTQRIIDYISVYNKDTASITLTIKFDASGTDRILWNGTLLTGEKVEYTSEKGFERYTTAGVRLGIGEKGDAGVSGTDGVDGALTVSEAEIDFGAVPVFEKTFTIVDSGVTASSKIIATQSGKSATNRQADENEMDSLLFSCSPGSGQFTLYARAFPGPISGLYKVNYQFS